jgi:hypothetical protein
MNMKLFFGFGVIALTMVTLPNASRAQPTNRPAPPAVSEELRQQLKDMSPEERRAKILELRGKQGLNPALTNQFPDLKNVSPEERRAMIEKMRGERRSVAGTNAGLSRLNAENMRNRLQVHADQLRAKKADSTITPAEQQQLDRLELHLKRLGEQQKAAPPSALPAPPPAPNSISETNKSRDEHGLPPKAPVPVPAKPQQL